MAFHLIFISSASFRRLPLNESDSHQVKVLTIVFPPFTYFESDGELVGGFDILLLNTIAERLNLNVVLSKTVSFNQITAEQLR